MSMPVIRTCPALDGNYPLVPAEGASGATFTANIYDLAAGGSALNSSAYTSGTEITVITTSGGTVGVLNMGHANVIADWDALTSEDAHILVEMIPTSGTTTYTHVVANDAEHLSVLFPDQTVYVDGSVTAPGTSFPYGSMRYPLGTADQAATVLAARGYKHCFVTGSLGGTDGPTSAGVGTAYQGVTFTSDTGSVIYLQTSQQVDFTDARFEGCAPSTANSGSRVLGPITITDAKISGSLAIGGTASRYGSVTATRCRIEGPVSLNTGGLGCWAADFDECVMPSSQTFTYSSMSGSSTSFVRCTGPLQIASLGASKTCSIVGHQGSPTITIAASCSTSATFSITGAVNAVSDLRSGGSVTLAKLAHLADLTGAVTTLADGAITSAKFGAGAITSTVVASGAITATQAPALANLDVASSTLATAAGLSAVQTHGDSAWSTATGFAVAGDAMALTAGERTTVQGLILSDATPFPGASVTETRLAELDAANLPTDVAAVSTAIGSLNDFDPATQTVTVGTNNDKAGYSISGTITTLDALDTAQDIQHATTQSAIGALNNLSSADVQGALTTQGYTTTRAPYLDELAAANLPTDVAAVSSAIAALNDVSAAAVADAVWDEALSGHVVAGSAGVALGAAGSGADAAAIADAVWDEALSGHTGTGSAGEALGAAGSGADAATIADAVWDEALSGHAVAGSAGASLSSAGSGADAATIADAVWDEALSAHLTSGTTGAALNSAGSGADAATIADAVWDEARAGHTTTGTFGESIQTAAVATAASIAALNDLDAAAVQTAAEAAITAQEPVAANVTQVAGSVVAGVTDFRADVSSLATAAALSSLASSVAALPDSVAIQTAAEAAITAQEPVAANVTQVAGSAVAGVSAFHADVSALATAAALAAVSSAVAALHDFDPATDTVTVGTNNDKAGYSIAGTLTTLDALDAAQDSQHATTQAAVTALPDSTAVQTAAAAALTAYDPATGAEVAAVGTNVSTLLGRLGASDLAIVKGLLLGNYVLDGGAGQASVLYDSNGHAASQRIRVFASAAAAAAATLGATNDTDGEIARVSVSSSPVAGYAYPASVRGSLTEP